MLAAFWTSLTRSGPSTLGADWERPGPDHVARLNDVASGLVVTLLTVLVVELSRSAGMLYGEERSVLEQLGWAAAISLPLTVRRRYPLGVLMVCSTVFLVGGVRSPAVIATFLAQVCFFSSLYTAAAWGAERRRTSAVFGVVCLVMFAWIAVMVARGGVADAMLDASDAGETPSVTAGVIVLVLINVVYFVGAWMIGTAAWRAARQRSELRLQTERLEAEQAVNARRAVLADRVRIARELHDVVAHHVSVIGVQAAAARRTLERDPDSARLALAAAEESSRQAVGEMRSLLGVLRGGDEEAEVDGAPHEPDDRAPQPGLDRLPALVGHLQDQGLRVELTVVGDRTDVSETVSLSLYRTVQEALANVLRHSTARSAHVTVRYLPQGRAVEVEVIDDGNPSGAPTGSGLGHQGMRERAALHDGQVEVGPRPFGGYRVRVRFPVPVTADVPVGAA